MRAYIRLSRQFQVHEVKFILCHTHMNYLPHVQQATIASPFMQCNEQFVFYEPHVQVNVHRASLPPINSDLFFLSMQYLCFSMNIEMTKCEHLFPSKTIKYFFKCCSQRNSRQTLKSFETTIKCPHVLKCECKKHFKRRPPNTHMNC